MVEKHYKNYVALENTLDNAKYGDNSPVSYSMTGQSEIFIDSWENIPVLTQTAIVTALTTAGYTEVP